MKRVSLKEGVSSGKWYECQADYCGEKFRFRIRFVGFQRSSVEEIDASLVDEVTLEGVLWILSLEVVNLNKKSMRGLDVREIARLIDEDGYEFETFGSDLDEAEGCALNRFSNWGDALSPKLKARGAVAFVLPDEETNYYFGLCDGNIREA